MIPFLKIFYELLKNETSQSDLNKFLVSFSQKSKDSLDGPDYVFLKGISDNFEGYNHATQLTQKFSIHFYRKQKFAPDGRLKKVTLPSITD